MAAKSMAAPRTQARVVITTDLDRTLVFSPAATESLGGGLPRWAVETVDGEVVSEIAHAVADGLRALPDHTHIVAVTARTPAQLARLALPRVCRYAVAANGGVVLLNGKPDAAWAAHVRAHVADPAALDAACKLLARLEREPWLLRVRRVDDLFAYAVIKPDDANPAALADLSQRCGALGWRAVPQGRKLYLLPARLRKEAAIEHVVARLVRGSSARPLRLAAGDGLLDRAMISSADAAWAPAGSQLAEAGGLPASVTVTAEPGHAGAAEIVAGWRALAALPEPRLA